MKPKPVHTEVADSLFSKREDAGIDKKQRRALRRQMLETARKYLKPTSRRFGQR